MTRTRAGWRTCCGWESCPRATSIPKEERAVRDLLRKRSQLVRQRTTNLLSIQNLFTRNTGSSISANRIKGLDVQEVDGLLPDSDLALAVKANLSVMRSADEQIEMLEQSRHRTSQTETRVQVS